MVHITNNDKSRISLDSIEVGEITRPGDQFPTATLQLNLRCNNIDYRVVIHEYDNVGAIIERIKTATRYNLENGTPKSYQEFLRTELPPEPGPFYER